MGTKDSSMCRVQCHVIR